jgi:NitT/TauT family transport system permease protein
MWAMLADGSLVGHWRTTVLEAGLGFILALMLALALGYFIAKSRILDRVLSPYIGLSQGLPVVALAPLLAIWFRDDLTRKVIIVALICFIPMLVNTVVAVRSIDRSMLEVARISGASWWQTVRYVELPLGARALLGGIKLGLTLSVTGAIVGEFVTADSGLGFLLTLGRGSFDTTLVFVGLVNLALLTMVLYTLVTLLERRVETWE